MSDSTIPIVADEDVVDERDLVTLAGCVDGVNLKLAKNGGIRATLAMIRIARALGLKTMLGCMAESAILTAAAAHVSPLVDWADIDSPFLVGDDPYDGISYGLDAKLLLADRPGIGVYRRGDYARVT